LEADYFKVVEDTPIMSVEYNNNNNNNNLCLIMVKTNCLTLHTIYNIQRSAQDSNDTTHRVSRRTAMTRHTECHAGQQQPGLAHLLLSKTGPPAAWSLCDS